MKRITQTIFLFLIGSYCLHAQNVGVNSTGAAPSSSAMLDVDASPNNTQGLLIPRLTDNQRQALPDPVAGLLIYSTTSNTLDFYNGTGWQQMSAISVSTSAGSTVPGTVGVAVNNNGAASDPSAVLDVSSTSKGLLIPRTTPSSVTAVAGLIIYNTNTNAVDVYDGTTWIEPCYTFIDNKHGTGAAAQGVGINATGASPDPSAVLDVASATQGLLIPRLTSGERAVLPSPATGLFIYNTTTEEMEYWTGSAWNGILNSGSQTYFYTGKIDSFIVPSCASTITIDARGAQGGTSTYLSLGGTGGSGARMIGTFPVTAGTKLYILVGQQGASNSDPNSRGGGGGGGTFVADGSNTPWIVAGGGGGGGGQGANDAGNPGLATQSGSNGNNSPGGTGGSPEGGGGGSFDNGNCCSAGGGGGFCGNGGGGATGYGPAGSGGTGCSIPTANGVNGGGTVCTTSGGTSYKGHGLAGVGCNFAGCTVIEGGYGGGAGTAGAGGGGGGGYSGGGGGGYAGGGGGGGGGGSFNGGTPATQTNTSGFQTGNGLVIITW